MTRLVRAAVLIVLGLAFSLTACSHQTQPALAGTSWKLTSWAASTPIPASSQITAKFDATTVSGSTGVNSYSGEYTSKTDGYFRTGSLRMTLIGSTGDAAAAEREFTNRIQEARSYRIDGDTLVLIDANGKDSLTFARVS